MNIAYSKLKGQNNRKLILLIFCFFYILNIISNGGHFDVYDGIDTFLVTESMVLHHSAKLFTDLPSIEKLHFDAKQDIANSKVAQTGKPYHSNVPTESAYLWRAPLFSAIAVPFYYAAMIFSVSPIAVVALFTNSLIVSLISVVVFCFSLKLYGSRKIAFISSLIIGVCSFAWSYVGTLEAHTLQALCIITSAFFIYLSLGVDRSRAYDGTSINNTDNKTQIYLYAGIGGVFLGLSVFAHPTSIIVLPGFVAYAIFSMWRNRKKNLLAFFIALGILLAFVGLVNYWRFGSFTEFGYGGYAALSLHNGWRGLLGLLISPGKGILFYFPIIILLPVALVYLYRENWRLFLLAGYVIIAFWLYWGTLHYLEPQAWTGAIGWGPRYIIPILPFVTIALGALLTHLKKRVVLSVSIAILCVVSFCVSLLGILVWYQYGLGYGWEREQLWRFDANYTKLKVNSYDAMAWLPQYSPIILHTNVLRSDYLTNGILAHFNSMSKAHRAYDWASNGLAPCSYDIYIYCKFGITPILLLSGIITLIAVFIMMEISDKFNDSTKSLVLYLKNRIKPKRS